MKRIRDGAIMTLDEMIRWDEYERRADRRRQQRPKPKEKAGTERASIREWFDLSKKFGAAILAAGALVAAPVGVMKIVEAHKAPSGPVANQIDKSLIQTSIGNEAASMSRLDTSP